VAESDGAVEKANTPLGQWHLYGQNGIAGYKLTSVTNLWLVGNVLGGDTPSGPQQRHQVE